MADDKLYLDICSDDHLSFDAGSRTNIIDRYGNWLMETNGSFLITPNGFVQPNTSQNLIRTIDDQSVTQRLMQINFSPNLWKVFVLKALKPTYNTSNFLVDTNTTPSFGYYGTVVLGGGGHGTASAFLQWGTRVAFNWTIGHTYVIAARAYLKDGFNNSEIEVYSKHDKYVRNSARDVYKNFYSIPPAYKLSFMSAAGSPGGNCDQAVKRMGFYPYSKVQQFVKQYL